MEHPVHDDEFAVEYPADEHGKISPQARPTAWRYGFQAAGHTITVRQTADALTITVDGRPLDTTSLDQSPTKHRGHKIASFLDDELRRITPHRPPPPGLPAPPRAPRARTLGIPPRVRGRLVFPPPRPPQVGPEGRSRTPQGAVEPRRLHIFANGQP